ncbi:MAG: DUF4870 domain-containing protein [Flavobacteriales bacterium]|nr:DUF4870 domain-containing protein [Flavobacteriales bacterium]
MTDYYELPQPEEVSKLEREDGMGAYLMMFAALAVGLPLPIINLIAAIIYYHVNKHKGMFVQYHALHSLLAQIPTTLLNAGAIFWIVGMIVSSTAPGGIFFGYLAMTFIANVLYFVFSIIAAMKARKGEYFYFIFFGKIAYHQVYKVREDDYLESNELVNQPPMS